MSPTSPENRTCYVSKASYDDTEANIYKREHGTSNTAKHHKKIWKKINPRSFLNPFQTSDFKRKKNLLCHEDPLTVKYITFGEWRFS